MQLSKNLFKLLRNLTLFLLVNCCVISAAQALNVRIDMSEALQRLSNSGYTIEDEIHLIGTTTYSAIVYDSSNQRAEVNIDSNSGAITYVKALPPTRIDWLNAAEILEKQGYSVISLENKGDHYRAAVVDSQDRPADLEVDKVTGKVIHHVIS